jgi:hypothetical protein
VLPPKDQPCERPYARLPHLIGFEAARRFPSTRPGVAVILLRADGAAVFAAARAVASLITAAPFRESVWTGSTVLRAAARVAC